MQKNMIHKGVRHKEIRKMFLVILCAILFTGCSELNQETAEKSQSVIQADNAAVYEEETEGVEDGTELLENETELLDESVKNDISHLRTLWKEFDEARQNDVDPTDNLKNSKYLSELKALLGKRESLEVSGGELGQLLKQSDYKAVDKMMTISSKAYHVRVIGYCVDFNEQVLTDMRNVKNKWIFVQCWNEDEFYFKTLSDGDVHYFTDFMPFELNNKLHIVVVGNAYPYGPYPGFAWTWCLEKDGFCQSSIFDNKAFENDEYVLDNNISFENSCYKSKWMMHTNGDYLFVEKGEKSGDKERVLLNISCKIDEGNKEVSFVSSNTEGEETVIGVRLIKGKFRVIIAQ